MSTRPSAPRPSRPDGESDAGPGAEPETFEATFARLEAVSHELEAGGLPLERAVDLYEEGMRLAERCQELLAHVEQRIETLRQRGLDGGADGGR